MSPNFSCGQNQFHNCKTMGMPLLYFSSKSKKLKPFSVVMQDYQLYFASKENGQEFPVRTQT